MPTTSIDTFFACVLIVSVAVTATVYTASNLFTQVEGIRDVNEQDYLRTVADNFVLSCGNPPDWGATGVVPQSFGLADANAQHAFVLDIDKTSRLSAQNIFWLSYPQIAKSSRLQVALGITLFQALTIDIELLSNETSGNVTSYSFGITVAKDDVPIASELHCYIAAPSFLQEASNATSDDGRANVVVQIPTTAKGTALFITFARAYIDARLTSVEVHSFGHFSEEPQPNQTFLKFSPLNYNLTTTSNSNSTTWTNELAFSFSHQSVLNPTSISPFDIPRFVEKSPILLVIQGLNGTSSFAEWTTYPQLPFKAGANFSNSNTNLFEYLVTVKGTFYKLRLTLGDFAR